MKRLLFRHWDLILSLAIGIECIQMLPAQLPTAFLKEAYSAGIAVLAVVFSVVFAAITLLASIGDDAFLRFLEDEDRALSTLLTSFATTLNILFVALLVSIVLFGFSAYEAAQSHMQQHTWGFAIFCFSLSYALISSRLVGNDVIHFAKLRARFIGSGE